MKILTVVGARPQFIKCAPVSRELRKEHEEVLVHTGQHYDREMSDLFFEELGIPHPDHNLGIGSGTHGHQTGAMLAAIEDLILQETRRRRSRGSSGRWEYERQFPPTTSSFLMTCGVDTTIRMA